MNIQAAFEKWRTAQNNHGQISLQHIKTNSKLQEALQSLESAELLSIEAAQNIIIESFKFDELDKSLNEAISSLHTAKSELVDLFRRISYKPVIIGYNGGTFKVWPVKNKDEYLIEVEVY